VERVLRSPSTERPSAADHRNARVAGHMRLDIPAITEPSADTASAKLKKPPLPGKSPSPTMPVLAVQRNASVPRALLALPTMTEPSAEIPAAVLVPSPPGSEPSSTRPSVAVHLTARLFRVPATTFPSAEMRGDPVEARSPIPSNEKPVSSAAGCTEMYDGSGAGSVGPGEFSSRQAASIARSASV
jgi:hypothetical protein